MEKYLNKVKNFIKKLKNFNVKDIVVSIKIKMAKKCINNPNYRTERLRAMSDQVIYWNNMEKHDASFNFEREYCQKMQKIYDKRFRWYKDKYFI